MFRLIFLLWVTWFWSHGRQMLRRDWLPCPVSASWKSNTNVRQSAFCIWQQPREWNWRKGRKELPTRVAVISGKAVLADTKSVLADSLLAAVVGTVDQRAVLSHIPGPALAGPVDAQPLVRAVVQTPPNRAVFPGEGLFAHTLAVDTQAATRAVRRASRLWTVVASKVTVTHTLPFHTHPLARTVVWAARLGAVFAGPAILADAAAQVKAEAAVAAAAWDKV